MEEQWVSEVNSGFGLTVKIKKQLCSRKSRFQQIDVYETVNLGKLLMLDGIIQLTSYDEFAYQEMMANLPFYSCAHTPEHALVIGGGDGGVLRELGRHPELKTLDICEIDEEVIKTAKEFLPELSCGFDDPRVNIHIGDGSEFIRKHKGCYDIIIVDSTDPGGPGEPLFGAPFYADLKAALRPGGAIGTQSESFYLLPETAQRVIRFAKENFRYAGFAQILVPTYPTGLIGCCVASDEHDVRTPARSVEPELQKKLRYYCGDVHRGSFLLPAFASRMFDSKSDFC